MSRHSPAHDGATTDPIRVDALRARLRAERLDRVNARRIGVGLPALRSHVAPAQAGTGLAYTRQGYAHLVLVAVVAVLALAVTWPVAVWFARPHGYARPAAPNTSQVTVPAPASPALR